MTKTTDMFIQNINIQSKNEWENYEKSLTFLLGHPEGQKHLILFEIAGRANIQSVLQKNINSEDDKTIGYIGARIFNCGMVCFRSCMDGYYQVSMSLTRDLIEIQFLLDYFRYKPEKIAEWRNSDYKQRRDNFSTVKLYQELDKRDGFEDQNRKKTYQLFCEYATHVTYPGIKLTANDKGEVMVGNFYDEKKLLNATIEIVRRFSHTVASLCALLLKREIPVIQSQLELMEYFAEVAGFPIRNDEKYKTLLAEIKELLKQQSKLD